MQDGKCGGEGGAGASWQDGRAGLHCAGGGQGGWGLDRSMGGGCVVVVGVVGVVVVWQGGGGGGGGGGGYLAGLHCVVGGLQQCCSRPGCVGLNIGTAFQRALGCVLAPSCVFAHEL
jgi:hypothetical protein